MGKVLEGLPNGAGRVPYPHGHQVWRAAGFRRSSKPLTLTDNPAWDDLDTLVIFVELVERLLDGTVLGPFLSPPSSGFHCSPMFTVPKDANGRRIILNYFSPVGASVNEDIDKR